MKPSAHILGAGGIGIAVAASLVQAGIDVTVVESNRVKVAAARRDGMSLNGRVIEPVRVMHFDEWQQPAGATVWLCTKTFDNQAILDRIDEPCNLVPIQNGYEPRLERMDHPAEAIASFVSYCPADRPVATITRAGAIHIGPRRATTAQETESIRALATALAVGRNFLVHYTEDVRPFKASKLMYNAAISPLAASAGVDNAQLIVDPLARRLFFALLRENFAILQHAGQSLETIGPFHPRTVMRILTAPMLANWMGMFFRPSLRGTYCSMSPDMGSGRTEIDAYNGHLTRIAGDFPCPLNRAVIELVERISRERLAPSREHLREMANALAPEALQ